MITEIQIAALVWITTFILGLKTLQTIQEHNKAKDDIKRIKAEEERADALRRSAESVTRMAEINKIESETRMMLANRIASMSEEQLAAYNRALDQPKKELVPMPYPVPYIPAYYPTYQSAVQAMQYNSVPWINRFP